MSERRKKRQRNEREMSLRMNVEFEETLNLRSKDFEKNKKESDERKKNS